MRDHRNLLLDTNNNNNVWVIFLLFVFKITVSKKVFSYKSIKVHFGKYWISNPIEFQVYPHPHILGPQKDYKHV